MRKLLFLLVFGFEFSSFAVVVKARVLIDASVNTIGTTYNTSFPQLALSGLYKKTHISITNTTAGAIACHLDDASVTVAPNSADGLEFPVASNAIELLDGLPMLANIYCRSASGSAATTGLLIIKTW